MEKKEALKDILVKARALSEITERTEEQNTELKSYVDRGQELRNEILRDGALDSFAETVADKAPAKSDQAERDFTVLGHDGGQFGAPQLVAEKKGFEEAVKAWKSGRKDARWGFDVRYKTDLSESVSESGSGAEVFNGSQSGNGNQFGGSVAPFYFPGIIEPPTRTPLIADLFAQGSTESNLVRLVKETFTSPNGDSVAVGGQGVVATAEGNSYGAVQLEVSPVDWPVRDIEFCGVAA